MNETNSLLTCPLGSSRPSPASRCGPTRRRRRRS